MFLRLTNKKEINCKSSKSNRKIANRLTPNSHWPTEKLTLKKQFWDSTLNRKAPKSLYQSDIKYFEV